MAKSRGRRLILAIFGGMFLLGFLFGYFLQGSTLATTEKEIDSVRTDLDTLQLEQLLLAQSPERSCPYIRESGNEAATTLYNLVNELGETDPNDSKFNEIKREATLLSVKSWLLSNSIGEQCNDNTTAILYIYSENCKLCDKQNEILQSIKSDSVGVYAIDIDVDQRIVKTIKGAYNITSTPLMIINGNTYTFLERDELMAVINP